MGDGTDPPQSEILNTSDQRERMRYGSQYSQAVDLIQDLARTHPDLSDQMKSRIDRMSDLKVKVAQFTKNGSDFTSD